MKNSLLTIALLGATITTTFADQVEVSTRNVIQRDGTFYSIFDTINAGKAYYAGQWYEPVDATGPNASWRTTVDDIAQWKGIFPTGEAWAKNWNFVKPPTDFTLLAQSYGYNTIEEMATDKGYPNPEAMAAGMFYGNLNNMAISRGFGIGDTEAMVNSVGGISYLAEQQNYQQENLQMDAATKGSLLAAIQNNELTDADYKELFQKRRLESSSHIENDLFKTEGQFDPTFTNTLLQALQDTNSPHLTEAYESLRTNFATNPTGTSQTDFSGWETPNLAYFPVNQANLTWEQINAATNLKEADFSGMDVANFATAGKNLDGVKFSNSSISGAQLNAANRIKDLTLQGTNLTGFNATGKNLININFAGATGISGSTLSNAADYQYTNFGTTDMTGFTPGNNANLNAANFTNTTNFNGSMLNNTTNTSSINVSGLNMTGFNPTGKNLRMANLANTTGFTASQLVGASNIQYTKLTGTGITKPDIIAALQTPSGGNKTLAQATSIANTITF